MEKINVGFEYDGKQYELSAKVLVQNDKFILTKDEEEAGNMSIEYFPDKGDEYWALSWFQDEYIIEVEFAWRTTTLQDIILWDAKDADAPIVAEGAEIQSIVYNGDIEFRY